MILVSFSWEIHENKSLTSYVKNAFDLSMSTDIYLFDELYFLIFQLSSCLH